MPDPASSRDSAESTALSHESIGKFRATYEAADNFARKVGDFCSDVAIPAHNELRYAGHHLLRALGDDGHVSDVKQLERAIAHCERAQYEAAEAGIFYALDTIEKFKEDYRAVVITDVVKDYREVKKKAREAQKLLTQTRSTAGSDHRGELPDPKIYMEMFEKLREICDELDDAREDLNKSIRKEKTSSRRFLITVFVSIIGTAASISYLAVFR